MGGWLTIECDKNVEDNKWKYSVLFHFEYMCSKDK